MKRLAIVLSLLAFSVASHAAAPDMRALAIQYLQVSRVDEILAETIRAQEAAFMPNVPDDARLKFHQILVDAVGWDATKDQLAEIVIDTYTADELQAYIAFMKTPAGASATAKSGAFSAKFSAVVAANFQTASKRLHAGQAQPAQ
jgi:hypothetical protein